MGMAKYYEDDMEIMQERLDTCEYYKGSNSPSVYQLNVLNTSKVQYNRISGCRLY